MISDADADDADAADADRQDSRLTNAKKIQVEKEKKKRVQATQPVTNRQRHRQCRSHQTSEINEADLESSCYSCTVVQVQLREQKEEEKSLPRCWHPRKSRWSTPPASTVLVVSRAAKMDGTDSAFYNSRMAGNK